MASNNNIPQIKPDVNIAFNNSFDSQEVANQAVGAELANELNTENNQSGDYASALAEKLDTQQINANEYSRLVDAAISTLIDENTTGSQSADGDTEILKELANEVISSKAYKKQVDDAKTLMQQNANTDKASKFSKDTVDTHDQTDYNQTKERMGLTDSPQPAYDVQSNDAAPQGQNEDSVSDRDFLANAPEGIAANEIEAKRLTEFREQLAKVAELKQKQQALNAQLDELRASKDAKDVEKRRRLQDEAVQTENRLTVLEEKLRRMEASAPLQSILKREKNAAETLAKPGENSTAAAENSAPGKGGSNVFNNLKPQNLMDELASSGVKYNPDEVITVTKTADGNLFWLEQGNSKSGLTHILERHVVDFLSQVIDDIPQLINNVLNTTPIKTGSNSKGPFADYVFNGKTYRIAYGKNGYIVSFYPID